ncbi:acetylornithine transaminase [Paludifilum halophilum]|uniref:Acetylornithine aminotransferase n=1 Tax=Paludifilum halophilum TaxID=1642702 RepID=A0A235B911_9BACL|nr:acetylornithine transaminase [Paludifilum halophilum]OYD08075.1 aspartate aminotransferase family protein [Paludifilum halophilum]
MTLFPTYSRNGIRPAKGEGAYLWDESGQRYLDFTSGLGVCNLGHRPPRVQAALAGQLDALWHVSNLFEIPLQEKVAARLTEMSGLSAAFFGNSGAEANEAAIKLARRYGQTKKQVKEPEVLTFQSSFHGRTLATLTATGQEKVKTGCGPYPDGFRSLPFNQFSSVKEAAGENTVAVMLEMVQGEGGVQPADPEFVRELHRFCAENEILLMVDEVQTGMGRTGSLFAFQQYGITPDVLTLAKGLGNGVPVGAMLGRADLIDFFGPGSHASTFGGNPLAMAAALSVIEELTETDTLAIARRQGLFFRDFLREKLSDSPLVREIRGRGLIWGVELSVSVAPLVQTAREKGLLVLAAGSNVLRLLPPLTVTRRQLEKATDIIAGGLAELEEVSEHESVSGI